jgi:branched-chain amino acid transport system ATP-binding protein
MSPLLEVDRLVVRYGPIAAVQELSLRVEPGEIVALLGPNGAGKSSLLNALVGLVPVAAGTIVFQGEEIHGVPTEQIVRRRLTLVPEGRHVFPQLSVGDNLRLGGAVQRDKEERERARRRVFMLFPVLQEKIDQAAGTLSGGQQQMLAIGRALMASPTLLLLDEPSLGLAPILVEEMFQLVARLRDEGTTILLVEQNVHQALELADRVYVLVSGRLNQEGPAADFGGSTLEAAYLGLGVAQ